MEIPPPAVQHQIEKDMCALLELAEVIAISDADLVSASLLTYFRRSFGKRWLTRFPRAKSEMPDEESEPWWALLPWDWSDSERKTWVGFLSLSDWLSHAAIYKVSQATLSALGAWQQGAFQIVLLRYVPTPSEVLKFQVQGIRPVTLLTDPESFWIPVERFPNAFELTIHDLIHVDRFQKSPHQMVEQIRFFNLLNRLVESRVLSAALQRDPQLKEDFEYVLSDMNTVPVHGLQYLKAILIQHFLRCHGLEPNGKLEGQSHTEFETLFQRMVALWEFPEEAREALTRVCTPSYRPEYDGPLIQQAVASIALY
ncbi:MAG: hypothetical protein K2X47_10220 [Bdellovibrionales bacterium]|nr:hypothetical protein [Bdellovibrionales bacterium]